MAGSRSVYGNQDRIIIRTSCALQDSRGITQAKILLSFCVSSSHISLSLHTPFLNRGNLMYPFLLRTLRAEGKFNVDELFLATSRLQYYTSRTQDWYDKIGFVDTTTVWDFSILLRVRDSEGSHQLKPFVKVVQEANVHQYAKLSSKKCSIPS